MTSTADVLFQATPDGFPAVTAVGRALSLRLFIPAYTDSRLKMDTAVHFKERVRTRMILISPKCTTCGGGRYRPQMYNPARTTRWEEWVGKKAMEQLQTLHLPGEADFVLPIRDARLLVRLRCNFRKPSSYPRRVEHMITKPDLDNVSKSIFDGLVKAGVISSDAAITDEYVLKRYVSPGHPAGIELELTAIAL